MNVLKIILITSLVFNLIFIYQLRIKKLYIKELHEYYGIRLGIKDARKKIREFLDEEYK